MSDNSDNLGDLTVNITGDLSELQAAIDQSVSVANEGGQQIAAALQTIGDASGLAGRDLEILQGIIQQDVDAGVTLAQSLQDIASSASSLGDEIAGGAATALANLQMAEQDAGDAAGVAAGALNDEADAAGRVGESSHEAESGLGAMAEGFLAVGEALAIIEGLKEFVTEAIEVYGATQQVITSLELMGQSAEEAESTISGLADMALTLAVPFSSLEQSARGLMVALNGVPNAAELSNEALQAAADSAARSGKSFDTVTQALSRVETQGQLTNRQLLQLGITWSDIANEAGTSVAAVQALLKKGGQDATADLKLVIDTIEGVAAGAAAAQAQTVLGQITILKNQVELLFDAIGQDIAPTVATIVSALSSIIQVARDVATEFQALPQPIKDISVAIGLAATAIVPLVLGVGALGIGLNAVAGIVPAYNSLMAQLAGTAGADALAEDAAAAATRAHGAAALAATPEIETLSVAEGEAAIAATASGAQMSLFAEEATVASGQMMLFSEDAFTAAGGATYFGVEATAAGVAISSMTALVGIGAVGITGIISGLRDAATSASQLATDVGTFTTAISNAGGPVELLKSGLSSMGVNAESAHGAFLNVLDVLEAIIPQLANSAWQSFANQMTFQIGPGIKLVDGLLVSLEQHLGLMPGLQQQVAAGFASMTGSIPQISLMTSGTAALATAELALQNNVTSAKQSVQELTVMQEAHITTLKNGLSVSTALAAAQVTLKTAQDALSKSVGESTKAAKDQKDSWEALETTVNNEATAMTNAQETYDALSSAFNSGKDSINGIAVNVKTLADAWNNLAAAQLKATGIMPQWSADAANVSTIVQNQANQFTKLQNAIDQTDAAFKAQQDTYNAALAAGTATDKQLQLLQIAYNDNQKAIGALSKAVDTTGVSMADLTGKASEAATVLVNGQAVAIGASTAIEGLAAASQTAGVNQQAFTGFVADGTAKIGDMVITTNASAIALGGEAAAADKSTVAVGANAAVTKDSAAAKTAAANAAIVLANKLQLEDQAWADGLIVMQNYAGVLVKETSAATDAVDANANLSDAVKQMASDMVSAGEQTNSEADALLALAAAADDAADAVDHLNTSNSKTKGSGASGGGAGLAQTLAQDMAIESSAALGGALGGGGINQSQIDAQAQALANATGEAVTTLDGYFVPAVAASTAATTTDTTATTSNTAAVTSNTTATVAATAVMTAAQTAFIASATAGDAIVTSFASLPPAVQDFLNSVSGTLVAYDDTTGALQYTELAANGLTETLNSAVSANELTAAASTQAATAVASVAQASTGATESISTLGTIAAAVSQTISTAATTLVSSVSGAAFTIGQLFSATANVGGGAAATGPGGAFSFNPGGYVNPNPDLMAGYAPSTGTSGVTLIQTISGNFVASDQSIRDLGMKAASAAITALRNQGGLKN